MCLVWSSSTGSNDHKTYKSFPGWLQTESVATCIKLYNENDTSNKVQSVSNK